MSDLPALLESVRAEPGEDTLRLAVADWYAENGDPERGEFVRIEVELARYGYDRRRGRSRRVVLEPRRDELVLEHGGRWVRDLARVLSGVREPEYLTHYGFRGCQGSAHWLWDRGFVFAVCNLDRTQITAADRIVRACPTVEWIEPAVAFPSTFHRPSGNLVGWLAPGTGEGWEWSPPHEVFDLIVGEVPTPGDAPRGAKCFTSQANAIRALSVAVAARGRLAA